MAGVERSERFASERAPRGERRVPPDGVVAEVATSTGRTGFTVSQAELAPRLDEAAGAEILAEVVLERLLEERCVARGIAVTDEHLAAERRIILNAFRDLESGGTAGEEESARVLDAVLARRGLGPNRFAALVRRQAMMRALVAPRVSVGEEQIALAYELRYGPRARVRIITTDRLSQAQQATRRIRAGEPVSAVAAELSTDPSGRTGGLLDEPVSPADAAYPASVREAVLELLERAGDRGVSPGDLTAAMEPHERLSGVLRLENGYALVYLDAVIQAEAVPRGAVADELAELMRRRQERLLMQDLARDLLGSVTVRPREEGLGWSWRTRDARR